MEITLTPGLGNLIKEKVKSGKFNSASEVVQASLRRMFADENFQNADKQRRSEHLRREIMKGVEQIRNGKGIVVDVNDLDDFAEEIIKRGLERRESLGEI